MKLLMLMRFSSVILLCLILLNSNLAYAAQYIVDRLDDDAAATGCDDAVDNDCSLRGAVIKANTTTDADEIILSAETYTLTIVRNTETGQDTANQLEAEGDLDIWEPLTITGVGADMTTIKLGDTFDDRAIHPAINTDGIVRIEGVTLDGNNRPSSDRGGLFYLIGRAGVTQTTLLDECHILNGSASDGGGVAMNNDQMLEIRNSTISANTASNRGGGLFCETGTCLIINSTLSENTSTSNATGGGGIQNDTGTLTIINSTIVNNSVTDPAGAGGGLLVGQNISIKNSILEGNTADGSDENCAGTLANLSSGGHNLSDDNTCATALNQVSDENNVTDPIVDTTLQDNGGLTPTHTLAANSPALDKIADGSCTDQADNDLAEDQRGFMRPADGDGDGTAACDSGAVEVGCGNGNIDNSEQCDDGNNTDGDGCDASCQTEVAGTGSSTGSGTGTGTGGTNTSGGCSLIR